MPTCEHHTPTKVVVIGGGYAGTLAANHLRMRADVDISLVNPRQEFVDRVRLHQFVAGTGEATVDYGTLLGEGVQLVVDSATRIDTAARTVRLASGRALDYDYVIYAVGSTGAVPSSVPGAAELAVPVAELESARRPRARLAELPRDAAVTVVGGGLTGIETAAELAEQGRTVTLVRGQALAPSFSAPARRSVATWLSRHGVAVLEGAVVSEVGDAAAPSGRPPRMSCYAAGPLGTQAADTVLSRIAGTEPAVINLAFSGACVSLGRRTGVRQFARKDDTAVNVYVGGRTGAAIKEVTCNFAVSRIRRESRGPGSARWFRGGQRPEQPASAPRGSTSS